MDLFDTLVRFYAEYGYWVLFFGVMLENAGVPLPGETALLIAGWLCRPEAGGHLALGPVIAVAFSGAVIGDNIGYWIGREVARPRLARGKGFLFLTPKRLLWAENYFHRYGAKTVFIARFVAVLRIVAGPAAGVCGMPWPRFLLANTAGAAVWATAIAALGYSFGHAWEALHRWLGWGAWAAVGTALVAFAALHAASLLRKRRAPPSSEPET